MSRVGQKPETITPEGYKPVSVIADSPQMSAMAAYDQAAEEMVFLKLRNPAHDLRATSRVENEADILASLSHPRIPAFRAANPEAAHPYIVTELKDNDPTVVRRFREFGDPRLAAELGTSALKVIAYVHEQNILHADIKPNNFLMTWEETVLTDFDISRRLDETRDKYEEPIKTVWGTLEYMSPEQVSADVPVDGRSDIYSMGQVLLYFLSGVKPCNVSDRLQILKNYGAEHDRVRHWDREVPPVLLDIADKALQLMPEDRYQSAAEMAEDLDRYLSAAGELALAA